MDEGLARRKVPEGRTAKVKWSEGGVLSPDREYLRIEGSGFRFDICAAPFGTGCFFSWWLTPKPASGVPFYLLTFLLGGWWISRVLAGWIWQTLGQAASFDWTVLALRLLLQNPFTIGGLSVFAAMSVVAVIAPAGWHHVTPTGDPCDDARRPTILSRLTDGLIGAFLPAKAPPPTLDIGKGWARWRAHPSPCFVGRTGNFQRSPLACRAG